MASRMKGFFQEKKKLGVSKPKKPSVKAKAAAVAAAATVSVDLKGEKEEEVLRQFDMNTAYGPCIGMDRVQRWNRADAFGLHPPREVFELMNGKGKDSRCLWDARV